MRGREFFAKAEMELKGMRPAAAIRAFERAERSGCDADLCSAGRWTCHMLLGQFESAWQESDRIAARGRPDPNRFWDGLPVDGRSVLVRCLHGLGDTLQFVRYAPLIRLRARRLIIQAQPPLKALLEEAQIADEVITWDEPEPYWNQQIEIVELPRIFRTTLASVPDSVPYLDTPAIYSAEGTRSPARNSRCSLFQSSGRAGTIRTANRKNGRVRYLRSSQLRIGCSENSEIH
jgi:hypothetical protein